MSHKPAPTILAALLIVLASFFYAGCFFFLPVCDPFSEEYDDAIRCKPSSVLEILTKAAFGEDTTPSIKGASSCFPLIICSTPFCRRVEENGSFEPGPRAFSGDKHEQYNEVACSDELSLRFLATTPNGPSNSRSSQVYQVIDLVDHLPPGILPNWRRARAQAAFHIRGYSGSDDQFGLHLAAYTGDPDAFPKVGDYETFSQNTPAYTQVAFKENFFQVFRPEKWKQLETEMMLPVNTDFLVVIVEAYENGENDITGSEFSGSEFSPGAHLVDMLQVALDAGPTPPLAGDDEATTNEDTPVFLVVLANDVDSDGFLDLATLTITNSPQHGSVTVSAFGDITYAPEENFFGTDFFSYVIADDQGRVSNTALVTVAVRPVNDVPVAADDTYQLQGSAPLFVNTPGVLGNDSDVEDNVLTPVLTDDVNNGTLALSVDGSFTYTPDPGFLGNDAFTYVANDGTDDSNEATVTLQRISAPNQPPTANDDAAETGYATAVTIDVLDNDSDVDGTLDPSTVRVTSNPSNGTVTVRSNGRIRYRPNDGFLGTDTFRYTVEDDDGAVSNEATVTVEVVG